MEKADRPERDRRKLPNFMYGAMYPTNDIGSGGATYSGALEWLHKHQHYMNQSLRYIQRYPNLIQERVLDPFWEYMEPLIYNNSLLFKYNDFLQSQFGFKENFQLGEKFEQPLPTAAVFFKDDMETRRQDYSYPIRRAFFCYDRTSEHQQRLKNLIVDQLEPFLSIRTNPTAEQAKNMQSLDVCRAICGSVFIMLINDNILRDQVATHLLSIAIAYKTPIIVMRESGYSLPANIPDTMVTYVQAPENAPFKPQSDGIVEGTTRKLTMKERKLMRRQSAMDEIEDGLDEESRRLLQEKENAEKQRQEQMERGVSLAAKIRELFRDSLIINPMLIGPTLSTLYEKLAGLTGATFPGDVPQLARDAATLMTKSGNTAHMSLPQKPIYKTGTNARTTVGFHQLINSQREANSNNNCSEEKTTPSIAMEVEDSHVGGMWENSIDMVSGTNDELRLEGGSCRITTFQKTSSVLGNEPTNSAMASTDTEKEFFERRKRLTSSHRDSSVLIPNSSIIQKLCRPQTRTYSVPFQYRQKTNMSSDSRLVKFRPGSSRASSARTRVLLNATLEGDHIDNYMGY